VACDSSAVDVGRIPLVYLVHRGLWMASAIRADKYRIVRGIRMASPAHAARVAMTSDPPGMSERRSQPICRGVAVRARGWYDSGGGGVDGQVIRNRPAQVRGALPLGSVATVTIGGRHG